MKNREEAVKELIVKLSLSAIPPIFQEEVINKLADLSDADLEKMISILDRLSRQETDYAKTVDNYLEFYRNLSERLEGRLLAETVKIQEELKCELIKNKIADL
jgi:hypothetical protein